MNPQGGRKKKTTKKKVRREKVVDRINTVIQNRLRKQRLKVVNPVTATEWLIKADLRERMESRPGSYLRSLCRQGKIQGAKKAGVKWRIRRGK